MAEKKFKFVSPGIFIDEIDDSGLPNTGGDIGPVVVGRSTRGPGMRPTRVESFSEFVQIFGAPTPGNDTEKDVWRNNNPVGPTYAAYAAQAWLRNNTPLTFVRLMGEEHPRAETTGLAGWKTDQSFNASNVTNGGAFGLFLIDSGSANLGGDAGETGNWSTGTLAAVWYVQDGALFLSGAVGPYCSGGNNTDDTSAVLGAAATSSIGGMVLNAAAAAQGGEWTVFLNDGATDLASNLGDIGGAFKETTTGLPAGTKKMTFNFDRNSSKFIRNVFNTNPVLTNSNIANTQKKYWLGETFEGSVRKHIASGSAASTVYGYIAGLGTSTSVGHHHRQMPSQPSKTGWFISQDTRPTFANFTPDGTNYVKELFRFASVDDGEWAQSNLKISIADIKAPRNSYEKYGTFSVLIREIRDTDNAPTVVEKFTNLNLNPASENFIAKRIGDQRLVWDDELSVPGGIARYKLRGDYPNVSRFVRVELNDDVKLGLDNTELLPFGVRGPMRYKGFLFRGRYPVTFDPRNLSSTAADQGFTPHDATTLFIEIDPAALPGVAGNLTGAVSQKAGEAMVRTTIPAHNNGSTTISVDAGTLVQAMTGAFVFPTINMRSSSLDGGLADRTDAFFGATYNRLAEQTKSNLFDESSIDVVRALAATYSKNTWDPTAGTAVERAWSFTLDDISRVSTANELDGAYISGSRASGESFTAKSGSYREVLSNGYDRFTAVLYGGFNGIDVTEAEPFGNHRLDDNSSNVKQNYAYYSVKKAIDAVADTEAAEMDILTVPGVTNSNITEHMINVCESRGDALAIIDIENDYTPRYESNSAESARVGTVVSAVNTFKDRGINSSYGCAFYPWVQVRDSASETVPGKLVWLPPSVAALGTFSSTQRNAELWFAPAGFNRGGLSEGVSGLNVVNVRQRLTSVDRDRLYGANVNPIAKFPSEGIVVFGQKTLQVTPSALDRINVRRLLIFLKKRISRVAASILFEPNVQTTWDRFLGRVNPLLESVKARFGLVDFKVVLDSSTTTDDLVDQNILYAKVFLKPTKAIEFIALDFVITNSGASFED